MKTRITIDIESKFLKTFARDMDTGKVDEDNEITEEVEKEVHEAIDEEIRSYIDNDLEEDVLSRDLEYLDEDSDSLSDYGDMSIKIKTEEIKDDV